MLTSKISCWKILSTVILLFIHSVLLHAQGKGVVIKDTIAISPRSNDPSSVSQTITKTVSAYPFFSFMAGTNDGNFGEPMVLGLWWCSDIPYNVRAEWNIYVESSNSDVSFYLELAGYKRLDHVGQVSSAVMSGAAEVGNRDTYNFYVGWRGYPSRVTVNDAGDTAIIHFERNYETEKILGTIILTATPGFALLPLHHFKLQMVPDSIGHGDTAQVFITAQNADSVEIFDLYCFNWLSINAGENQFGHFEFITSPNAAISAGNSPLKGRNSQTLTRRLGKAAAAMETPPYEFDYYYLPFLGHLYYIADSELPKSDTAFAVTVASVYDTTIKGIDSVVIKAGFDHFEVTFDKDTAAFTESAKIFVQAKDANDIDVELEADKLLTLSVIPTMSMERLSTKITTLLKQRR